MNPVAFGDHQQFWTHVILQVGDELRIGVGSWLVWTQQFLQELEGSAAGDHQQRSDLPTFLQRRWRRFSDRDRLRTKTSHWCLEQKHN